MKVISIITSILFVWIVGFACGYISNKPQETPGEKLSDWQVMELAIMKTESEFNTLATGRRGDLGVLQITPIYVQEVNRILGSEEYCHEDAFNPQKSIEMFNIMQGRHNEGRDIDKAIKSHNPTASNSYSIKVRKNMAWVENYEQLRKLVR